jgi:nickel transport protein
MHRRRLVCIFALLAAAGVPRTASAHKLNVFAYVEGQTIRGEAYYRGRTPARDAKVVALDPAGKKLSETRTDEQGNFSVRVRYRCDHRLTIDAGEGHTGEYTLSASELPASLPPWEQPAAGAQPLPATAGGQTPAPAAAPSAASADSEPSPAAVSREDEVRALRIQIVQLREELAAYRQEAQFRDIVGAAGYILGLGGVAFYFLGVRKKAQQKKAGESVADGSC